MNVFLWIVQAVLAGMFAIAGVMKSTQPKGKLVGQEAGVPAPKSFGGLFQRLPQDRSLYPFLDVDSILRFFVVSGAVKMDRSIRLLDWLV
ncbi:hypothetical protein ADK57_18175 [Streptomyces sp. MMG1533]|uniref:hypothetical protein n=1 Tax=Streptomyces sp. MMG1533 TaxID=1415546 RepID=UPI0006AE9430|nr:hypothetical protein [Streptomyces sp. MMG1533]KOU66883.1 hypothetical protein ADK57_18175 [Streptomyces sp. MMG1533]